MLHLKVNSVAPQPEIVQRAAIAVREGHIVAFPTDTFYGLAVDPVSAAAIAHLFEVKGRPAERAVPLVAADAADVERLVVPLRGHAAELARRFWPGPLSLVLPAPENLTHAAAANGTLAVRVPGSEVARDLARSAGGLITATSANLSGMPPAATADAVIAALGESVAIVLDAGPAPGGMPSTIVDARERFVRLVREGAVPWNRVLESLQ